MIHYNLQKIIVDYIGPDIMIKTIIDFGWDVEIFFKMNISYLRYVLDYLQIKVGDLNLNQIYNVSCDSNYCMSYCHSTMMGYHAEIIYELFYVNACTTDMLYNKSTLDYHLSKYTPLSTEDYIKKYPKAINFKGLCQSKYVDFDYLVNNYFSDIDWKSIVSNTSILLSDINKHSCAIINYYYYRPGVSFDDFLEDESKIITLEIAKNPSIPANLIIKKYRHRTDNDAFEELITHHDIDFEYIFNNCKDNIIKYDHYLFNCDSLSKSLGIKSQSGYYLIMELCMNPNLPFDIIFEKYSDLVVWKALCFNINLPFDYVLDNFEDRIRWHSICLNINFPVRILNNPKYTNKCKSAYMNEHLDFDKIKPEIIEDMHYDMIKYGNKGYYTYLAGKELIKVLDNI